MLIGIDASRAYISDKTGTENYSYHLINAMLRLPEAKSHIFVLFIRPNTIVPKKIVGYSNVIVKEVKFKYLWTQVGLAWSTRGKFSNLKFSNSQIEVLWVPAHTLPLLRRGFGGLGGKLRTVVTIHGLEYQWLPEYKNWLQKWYLPLSTYYAAKYADKLIAVSQFTANQLKKELHTSSKKIKVVYEGVDFGQPEYSENQLYQQFGITKKQYVLFVGTIQPRKNLVALIEAFALIAKDLPGIKLVIAGAVGWDCEEVLRAPSRYGIQEKVVFTGRVGELELSQLYQGAALYVQPSLTEGFGLPVLEAMAHKVPVVSSDGGALKEVVGDGGVLVNLKSQMPNPLRSEASSQIGDDFAMRLADAMKQVLSSKKRQDSLISMGLKRVKSFTWEKAAKDSLEVIVGEGYNRKFRF